MSNLRSEECLHRTEPQQITRRKNLNQQATKSMRLIYVYMYSILHIAVTNRVPRLAINTYVKSSMLLCLTMNCLHLYDTLSMGSQNPWLYRPRGLQHLVAAHQATSTPSTSSIDTPPDSTEDRCFLPCVSPVLRITSIWCGPKHDESVSCLGTRHDFGWVCDDAFLLVSLNGVCFL